MHVCENNNELYQPEEYHILNPNMMCKHCQLNRSVRKAEIQPLIPLITRRLKIRLLLLLTHTIPPPVPPLINRHIIHLRANKHHEIIRTNRDQNLVSAAIQRLVVFAVDVLADDAAGLHAHVVERRGDGARAHCAGVARRDGHEDGVDVGVADEQGREDPAGPGGCGFGEEFEGDEEGEGPDLGEEADEEALVELFAEPGPEEELADEDGVCGDLGVLD